MSSRKISALAKVNRECGEDIGRYACLVGSVMSKYLYNDGYEMNREVIEIVRN